jgi:hypothetical protein
MTPGAFIWQPKASNIVTKAVNLPPWLDPEERDNSVKGRMPIFTGTNVTGPEATAAFVASSTTGGVAVCCVASTLACSTTGGRFGGCGWLHPPARRRQNNKL